MKEKKIQLNKLTNKLKSYKLQASQGFTLIEAVVSVSLFAITVTSILGVYMSVQRLNRDSRALQAIQQNGRFISEDITKIIRNGSVDYDSYPVDTVPKLYSNDLYMCELSTSDACDPVRIFRQGTSLMIERSGITRQLTGDEIEVNNFRVYIWPAKDPFTTANPTRHQPVVTVFLDLESQITNAESLNIPFQITAATKQYPVIE